MSLQSLSLFELSQSLLLSSSFGFFDSSLIVLLLGEVNVSLLPKVLLLCESNFVESGSFFLFSLDFSKSLLFEEVSFVDDIQRVVLIGDEGLFNDWNVWVLALVALDVFVFHDLHVVPAVIYGM